MNMVNFITSIRTFLLTKHASVYFQKAPASAEFPYLVFDLPTSFNNAPSEDFLLEIDAWDNNQDTTILENIIDSIDEELNNKIISFDKYKAIFRRENRLTLPDEDPTLNRRQLRYTVRVY